MTALLLLRFLLVSSLSQWWPGVLGDEAAVEVSLSVVVDDEGTRKDLFVAQGEEPEGPALLFCRDHVGGLSTEVLVECVAELSSQVTIERVRRALPTDAPLPALQLQVKVDEEGHYAEFSHDGGEGIDAKARAWCADLVQEEESKKVVQHCAERIVANARMKVIEATVAADATERRATIDALIRTDL